MVRFAAVLMVALSLAACGQQGPTLEGRWGVFDAARCEGDTDTMEFADRTFSHRRGGNVVVSGTDLAFTTSDAADGERITAIFNVDGQVWNMTFARVSDTELTFQGAAIDGEASVQAERSVGRSLYRCE